MVWFLTKEEFVDPVVAADGQSYERVVVQSWLSENGAVSPATGQALTHTALLPNHALRSFICCNKQSM